ncbi:MAG TPA: SpoIIE family protein phosphatase [Actinospica sp.]|nr:SpoIIE family protein phosphatase [Actinospica sp.]
MAGQGEPAPSDAPGDRPAGPAAGGSGAGGSETAVIVIDARGAVTDWNDGARRLLGYPAAEVLGRPAQSLLIEPVSREDVRRATIADPARWYGTIALRHRDGHRVEAAVVAHRRVAESGDAESAAAESGADEPATDESGADGWSADEPGAESWRIVSALGAGEPRPQDADLARWAFEQLPRCSIAVYDANLGYRLSNQAMAPVIGLPEPVIRGLRIEDITTQPQTGALADGLRRALASGEPVHLESFQRTGGQRRVHAWSVDFTPLKSPDGEVHGVGLVAHDTTKQYWARKRLVLLNEAAGRVGSTLDIGQTARELLEVTVPELADFASIDLLTAVETDVELEDGVPRGMVRLRRIAHRFGPGGGATQLPVVGIGAIDSYPEFTPPARALATGAGILSDAEDPGFVRWMATDALRAQRILEQGYHSMLAAPLRARGVTLGVALFYRRSRPERMERFDHDDLLLVEELAARAAIAIDNARRYTRERETALSLQRSLLPRRLPEQSAVEVATRYQPAGGRSGIGGDWFDVIPLSGARVALVVGDVVGHGIHALATMGRLRTAVRTLADVDLPPDELLTHLDDLVIRLSAETEAEGAGETEEIGATCCYAVYDPVSRSCVVASAGHPPPVIVPPGAAAAPARISAGPPLGIGGLPFESTEVALPEGSLLALCSNGLLATRERDIDFGFRDLCRVLERPAPSLEAAGDAVLDALVGGRPQDDVTLLIARTRALDVDHVVTWDVPPDPSSVSQARKNVDQQLTAWGLSEESFAVELIVSELVTNAIRYGASPISLRLIRDRTLICEVSDAGNTSPHLRRARAFDEGGRGLMLVAQLAHRWGTRHAPIGKTIWTETIVTSG